MSKTISTEWGDLPDDEVEAVKIIMDKWTLEKSQHGVAVMTVKDFQGYITDAVKLAWAASKREDILNAN